MEELFTEWTGQTGRLESDEEPAPEGFVSCMSADPIRQPRSKCLRMRNATLGLEYLERGDECSHGSRPPAEGAAEIVGFE